jgi:DNA primase
MNLSVQKIKERLSIEEVVSSYIKLEKAGANLKAKCPFHNEKTPSFFVSPDRGSYYCFGCGAKGDIFTFVEEFEGLDFKGALRLLANKAGVTLEAYTREEESEKERLYRAMEEATVFFENNLKKNSKAMEYLKSRGVKDETIKNFRIGFVEDEWRGLYNYLKTKGFDDREIELAGLAKRAEDKSKGMYDRFRGRIMFPISDSSGRVIAFSGRILMDDGKSAKYLNSTDTPIFNKSYVLYGLDKAKDSIRKNNFSILVEGQIDLILSHQAGFKNTVASSGTALSDAIFSKENIISNLGLIRRLSPNIVLAFDADRAGINAAARAGKIALSLGMDVKVAQMPDGIDPADLVSKSGPDAWREAIRNSRHIIEFLLEKALKNSAGDMRKAGREIKEKVLPYVNYLESSIEKAHFLKRISNISQIPESALREDLKKVEKDLEYDKKETEEIKSSGNDFFRKEYIERRLLGIILWQKSLSEQLINTEEILKEFARILNVKIDEVLKKVGDSKEDLIFEAEVFYEEGVNLEKDVKELLSNLEEECLKEKLAEKMKELYILESKRDKIKSAEILKEIGVLSGKIQNIKNGRLSTSNIFK